MVGCNYVEAPSVVYVHLFWVGMFVMVQQRGLQNAADIFPCWNNSTDQSSLI